MAHYGFGVPLLLASLLAALKIWTLANDKQKAEPMKSAIYV